MRRIRIRNVNGISIHPPREGWDGIRIFKGLKRAAFQSTHPVRGGTCDIQEPSGGHPISIHPPREGWDSAFGFSAALSVLHFNPPTP